MKYLLPLIFILILKIEVFGQNSTISPEGVFVSRVSSLGTCASPSKGQMVYLNSDNKMYYCNGSSWLDPSSDLSFPISGSGSFPSGLFNITNSGSTGWGIQSKITNSFNNSNALISYTAGGGSAAYLYTSNNNGHALKTFGDLNFAGIEEADGKVLTSDASGNATWKYSSQVAFALKGTPDWLTFPSFDEYERIFFANEEYNLNGNVNGGIFTAPFNGIYHFDATVKRNYDQDYDAHYSLSFWKNDTEQNILEAYTDTDLSISLTLSTDIKLNAGDNIRTKLKITENIIFAPFHSFILYTQNSRGRFSGHLVTRLE